MHIGAPSHGKRTLCNLKRGILHTNMKKLGATCPMCYPVPMSVICVLLFETIQIYYTCIKYFTRSLWQI